MRPMEPKYSRHEIGPNMDIIVLTDDGPDAPDETGLIQFEPVQNNPLQILFLFIVNILSNQKSFDYHQALVPIILQVRDTRTLDRLRDGPNRSNDPDLGFQQLPKFFNYSTFE